MFVCTHIYIHKYLYIYTYRAIEHAFVSLFFTHKHSLTHTGATPAATEHTTVYLNCISLSHAHKNTHTQTPP